MRLAALALCLCILSPLCAQDDFLTTDEIDQIRIAQEPNLRLKLYADFATQRVAIIKQMIAEGKPGRSFLVHETLVEYTEIIEAMDYVTDDALSEDLNIDEGMVYVIAAEKKSIAELEKIQEADPADLVRYQFVLEQAIETTADSIELGMQDLEKRGAAVKAADLKEKQKIEGMMQPKDLEAREAARKEEEKSKRKAPTLRREGDEIRK